MIRPTHALLHPLWWGALALLLANDHYFKGAGVLAPAVTGKLSDFAGLLVAPMLLAALLRCRSQRGVVLSHVAVGLGFSLFELSPAAARAFEQVMGLAGLTVRLWPDLTDLIALLMLPVSYGVLGRLSSTPRQAWMQVVRTVGCGVGLLACVATSKIPPAPPPQLGANGVYVRDGNALIEIDRQTGATARVHSVQLGEHNYEDALVVDDAVYFTRGVEVCAVELRGKWGPWCAEGPSNALLAVGSGLLYAQTSERLRAFDAASGRVAWSVALKRARYVAPVAVEESVVVIDDQGKDLVAFDVRDGRERWRHLPDGSIDWLGATDSRVIAAMVHGGFAVLDARSGRVLVESDAKAPAMIWTGSGPWALAGRSLARQESSELVVFDIDSGRRRFERSIDVLLTASEDLIFTLDDDALVARDAVTGAVRWRLPSTQLPNRAEYEPAAVNRGLLVLGKRQSLIAIDTATGRKLWDRGVSIASD